MADQQAGRRIQAIGQQLQPSPSGLPPIQRVAAGSSAPRAQGKVVIITGKDATPPPPFLTSRAQHASSLRLVFSMKY